MTYTITICGQELTFKHYKDYDDFSCYTAFLKEMKRARTIDLFVWKDAPKYRLRFNGPWGMGVDCPRGLGETPEAAAKALESGIEDCLQNMAQRLADHNQSMRDFTQVSREAWIEREAIANTLGRRGKL